MKFTSHRKSQLVRRKSNRGATLVEFAIVFPIAFLLFFALIEISRVLLLQHSADTAAYEGARAGMVPGASASDAIDAAMDLCNRAGLRSCQVKVYPDKITESTPVITVQVEIKMADNAWAGPIFFNKSKMISQVTLLCERPPMIQVTGLPILRKKAGGVGGTVNQVIGIL